MSTLLWACGDEAEPEPEAPPDGECSPGTAYSCYGPGGCQGRQVCADGELTRCRCADDPAAGSGGGMLDAAMAVPDAQAPGDAEARDAQALDAGAADAAGNPDAAVDAAPAEDAARDAADSCPPARCVQAPPADWSGPVALYAGAAPAPACGGDYPQPSLDAYGGLSAAPATCSTCSCTAGSCAQWLNFTVGTASDCSTPACSFPVNEACVQLSLTSPCLQGEASGYVGTAVPAGASPCTPSPQTPQLPAAQWSETIVGCAASALSQHDCASDELCAPPEPAAPFGARLCIHRAGDHACPAGEYSDKQLYHRTVDDTRGCSACGCSESCSYTFRLYDAADATCETPQLTLQNGGQCAGVTPTAGTLRVGAAIEGDGSCTASGGAPQGSATATDPVTVCCAS